MTTTATTPLDNKEVTVPPALVAQCHSTSSPAPDAVAAAMGAAFGKVEAFLQQNSLRAAGPPRAVYTGWGANSVEFTAAVPIPVVPAGVRDTADVKIAAVPECSALRFVHRGPYSELRGTYARIEAWLRERGGIKAPEDWARYSPMWEEYQNDPATTPPSDLLTHIYLTLR
jgi:effector-binding domain-containing protein